MHITNMIANERLAPDKRNLDPIERATLARRPCLLKTYSGNRCQKVDPIGLDPQLNGNAIGRESLPVEVQTAKTKLPQGSEKTRCILFATAWIPVPGDGESAHDEVLNRVRVE